MTPYQVSKAINGRFVAGWTEACSRASAASVAAGGSAIALVPYSVDNITMPEGNGLFARLSIISLGGEQRTIGPRRSLQKGARRTWQYEGVIEVRISGPKNQGRGEGDLLAGEVRRLFQGVKFSYSVGKQGVVTTETEINELRRDAEAISKWILLCSTPFTYTDRS